MFDRVIEDTFVLTERACVCLMKQIAEGVSYMHHNQILHLDLKPENVLCLTRSGNRIKIIDFGLARRHEPYKKLQVRRTSRSEFALISGTVYTSRIVKERLLLFF